MHGDKKIGLALSFLLLGIVGAFFFRNDVPENSPELKIRDSESLDRQIAERAVRPYLSESTGANDHDARREQQLAEYQREHDSPSERSWEVPRFLRDQFESAYRDGDIAPDPIGDETPFEGSPLALTARSVRNVPTAQEQFAINQQTRQSSPAMPHTQTHVELPPPPTPRTNFHSVAGANSTTREYVVRHGDTLSELAERFLGSSRRYTELYDLNRDRMRGPDALRVGRPIRIPVSGAPTIASAPDKTDRVLFPEPRRSFPEAETDEFQELSGFERWNDAPPATVREQPPSPSVRLTPKDDAVPSSGNSSSANTAPGFHDGRRFRRPRDDDKPQAAAKSTPSRRERTAGLGAGYVLGGRH